MLICDVNQDNDLEWKLMHVLDFILNLHCIVLKEIYTWNHYVFKYLFHKLLKFFLLPMNNKIVYHKG
jgi:hypothetical protein